VLAALGAVAVLAGTADAAPDRLGPAAALAGLATLAPTLAANAATTGNPFTYAYTAVSGSLIGLNQGVPWGTMLTGARGLGLTAVDAHQLNVYLLEWPVPVTVLAGRSEPGSGAAARVRPHRTCSCSWPSCSSISTATCSMDRGSCSRRCRRCLVLVAAGLVGLADLERPGARAARGAR
jgi:hypothetical protein